MIYDLQQTDDPRDIVHRSVQTLVEGDIIGLPSETVYGVVASALCPEAVERIAAMVNATRRDDSDEETGSSATTADRLSPGIVPGQLALCLRSSDAAGDYLVPRTKLTRRLSERCFPGPLTLISECDPSVSAAGMLPESVLSVLQRFAAPADSDSGESTGSSLPIAFRVSNHRLLSHIHRYLSAPLVWAEFSQEGGQAISTAERLDAHLCSVMGGNPLPVLLDDGVSRYGGVGTIVQVTGNSWHLLREGVIQRAAMNQFAKPVIVIVCTGNTCRSPMAETLLRDLLHRRFGREDVARVLSAGVAAQRGSGASPQSVEVMGRRGLDLTGHCSQPLDDPLMSMADLVLTLTRRHRDAILAAWPDRKDRVFTLRRDGGDVSDPVGMPVDVYEQCADQIRDELEKWLDALDDDFFPKTSDTESLEGHNGPGSKDESSNS
ncbi:arsenate reductase/protein-tyrosine-phosphatase family protein [Rhodopirellula sallentina]|uniref:L-threonylcarbamoyladenylate synthase n=1 Tax=Rhodopirellula sallentina SM41 TaxID=1263870 RepID=M5U963_9BACT|nr:Sua5/YciO/YrdC/YwlC family protein [Rhodopirellula sallentina]EMI52518.1 protein-tyrosine phosphatase, low molecular weight [Rhodopirellula sallentina SM41]